MHRLDSLESNPAHYDGVREGLASLGLLETYYPLFVEHGVDDAAVAEMDKEDFREMAEFFDSLTTCACELKRRGPWVWSGDLGVCFATWRFAKTPSTPRQ